MRSIADYTLGLFIVLGHLVLLALRERREPATLPRETGAVTS
jgi:hypothetical protein